MIPWTLTDNDAKNIYNALCKYYGNNGLPHYLKDYTGVFLDYENFTRDKLWYCIEYLKKNFGKGWFTEDITKRDKAFSELSAELYDIFQGLVDQSGIRRFITWIYNFAANDADAIKYFGGANYSLLDNMKKTANQTIVEPVKQTAENVAYAVSVPSLKSLLPDNATLIKWGLIIGGGLFVWKFLENRANRI